ncbi:MAG: glycogen synthase GlgA [Ignavibacteriaceae bacterium]|nr:glycogen synthase GlgA [Ignavibacteriaceae bacterium]
MKIAFIASEAVPFVKTGGLADVAGVLPKALEKLGCEVKVYIPKYSIIDESQFNLLYRQDIGEIKIKVADKIRIIKLYQGKLPNSNVTVIFIDCPWYFHRESVYTNDPDEDERFILFCRGAIEAMRMEKWSPDIIHCNDWQTGLIPLYIKDNFRKDPIFVRTKTLLSIHNIGYQGRFPRESLDKADLNQTYYFSEGPVEINDSFSFLKTGIWFADIITTVSETYAREILTSEYGKGLENALILRRDSLYGILNGVDYNYWDPAIDNYLPFHYSGKDLSGKLKDKEYLLNHFNLKFDVNVPLIGIISRLVDQKGFDIFSDALPELIKLNAQWVIIGNGEPRYENIFRSLTLKYPDKVASFIGFSIELSHLVEAGSDIFLMPSHYEPCGLTQIYSLKYGTVPIVRKTGGLADTVQDWDELQYQGFDTGNGFSFNDYSGYALFSSVKRAIDTFPHKDTWNKIRQNGMIKDFSWDKSARKYVSLYENLISKQN